MAGLGNARKTGGEKKRPEGRRYLYAGGGPGTGSGTYVPGKGQQNRGPSGKATTFEGKGPAPSGSTKVPEKSYTEVPTVTVSPTGAVSTSGYAKEAAAKAAVAAQARRAARVKRIVALVTAKPPKRPQIAAPKAPVVPKVAAAKVPVFKPTGATPAIRKQEVKDNAGFYREQAHLRAEAKPGKVKVAAHTRKAPTLKGTPQQRKVARARVQQTKAVLRKSGSGELRSGIVTTPEQSKVAKTILRTGQKEGANRKEKLAALDTGLQESGLKNLPISGPGGGWRQEESAYYPEASIKNVRKGAENFFSEAKSDTGGARGRGESVPHLSQAVQASGAGESYYVDNVGEAKALLHQFNQGNPKAAANYQAAVKEAKDLGLKVAPNGRPNVGKAPAPVVKKFKQAVSTMKEINSKGYEYQWGGGHAVAGSPTGGPGVGYDCSGAISAMLHSVHDLEAPLVSGSMGQALDPGPGAITVFYNSVHTFAYIPSLHKYWGTSESNPGGGAGFFPKSVGDSEVASGNSAGSYSVGHVPGLGKKQALQLGAQPGSMTSTGSTSQPFPGMTLSPSGTSASIDSGSGTKQRKPSFSTQPIRLSAPQRVAKVEAKLQSLSSPDTGAPSTAVLDRLEKKYG